MTTPKRMHPLAFTALAALGWLALFVPGVVIYAVYESARLEETFGICIGVVPQYPHIPHEVVGGRQSTLGIATLMGVILWLAAGLAMCVLAWRRFERAPRSPHPLESPFAVAGIAVALYIGALLVLYYVSPPVWGPVHCVRLS